MGEPLSFEEVYRLHGDRVYRFCISQMGDWSAAEDLAADVWVQALSAYERAKPDAETVHVWLFHIARNRARGQFRRRKVWRRIAPVVFQSEPIGETVEVAADIRDDLRLVLAAVATLRWRDRQLVGLRVAGGLSFREIGESMGMTENAAAVAFHRALDRVRLAVEQAGGRRS